MLDKLFREPSVVERPLRILVYGEAKTGKSHFVYTATEVGPLYWQDSESGADLYPPDRGHGFKVMTSKDPWKTIQAIEAANKSYKKGNPRPIVALDSMSSVWFQQKEVANQLGGGRDRTPFWAWGAAKKPLTKLYDMIHTTRCHVIITARAKMKYEVQKSGEPIEKGLEPDVERNLSYAMDLVIHTYTDEVKGKELKPNQYKATVMGTRSPSVEGKPPAIPVGKTFSDPKFSDFLEVMIEGVEPTEIEDTTSKQVKIEQERPENWAELKVWIDNSDGWDVEKAKEALVEKFGSFDVSKIDEYYDYLRGR